MKHFITIHRVWTHIAVSGLLMGLAIASTGCGGDETGTKPLVNVPEIQGTVASADFCKLHDQIECAGAMGCCSGGAAPFASEAECMAASTCAADLAKFNASPLVTGGTIAYDPAAAADYLRTRAALTSTCDPAKDMASWASAVLIGTLAAGSTCPETDMDVTEPLVCKPGLGCRATEDPMTGANIVTCAPAAPRSGGDGAACKENEDCSSGACVNNACAAKTEALYCVAPPDVMPPANSWSTMSTTTAPLELQVVANSNANSGTINDITLVYRNKLGTFECTITDTIADGGKASCTPTQSSTTVSTSGYDYIYVKFADKTNTYNCNDGLRVSILSVKHADGMLYSVATFNAGNGLDCTGCNSSGDNCNSCWIDCDGHSDCGEMKTPMSINYDSHCL